MLKLTKTGIGLLTKQYRSVLKKCLLLNLGLLFFLPNKVEAVDIGSYAYTNATSSSSHWHNGGDGQYLASDPARFTQFPQYHYYGGYKYQTISSSYTIIQNLEALDFFLGSYTNARSIDGPNHDFLLQQRINNTLTNTVDYGSPIATNLEMLDFVIGVLPSGTYVSNMQSMGDNVKALDTAIGAKITSDGHYIKKSDTNSVTANLSALDYALYNYYYTFRNDKISEAAEFTKELKASFPVILRSAEHDVRISAQSAARIDTGLKSGDRHVASLLTMTNLGVNVSEDSLTFSAKKRNDSLGLMEVCHA